MSALQRMEPRSIPTAPPRDHRHVRHSPKTIQLARTMHDSGWTPTQIRRYIRTQVKLPVRTIVRVVRHDHGIEARWVTVEAVQRILADYEKGQAT